MWATANVAGLDILCTVSILSLWPKETYELYGTGSPRVLDYSFVTNKKF